MSVRLLAAGLLVGAFSSDAAAAVPRIVGRPTVRNPSFTGTANTMMYTVSVTVDGMGADTDHAAVVGYVSDDEYTTCADTATPWKWSRSQTFDVTDTKMWTLYNFVPGTIYHYKVMVGDASGTPRVKCGILQTPAAPTPTLPDNLSYLNIQYQSAAPYDTRYVLIETDDCGTGGAANPVSYYLVVVDPVNEAIVWYLDVAAVSGDAGGVGSGLDYEVGATPTEDRIHLTVGKQFVFEWAFDGRQTAMYDFGSSDECSGVAGSMGPCIHHDVVRSETSGNTYAVAARLSSVNPTGTDWDAKCGLSSRFIDEGYQVLDSSWNLTSEQYLMSDYGYDPTVDGGPSAAALGGAAGSCDSRHWSGTFDPAYGAIDWIHENALSVSSYGTAGLEVVDLSLKEWDQVIRFDATTGARIWSLSSNPGYTDWGAVRIAPGITGAADFASQHDVHAIANNTLMMVDNRGESTGTRAIQIELTRHPLAATIQKSWALVDPSGDPVRCPIEGTAQQIPGGSEDHALAVCNDEYEIVEMDDPTGNTGTAPPLAIWLPDGTTDAYCTVGGPSDRNGIQGWHKAYPLARVGEF